ncbi:ATP-binding protein [Neolewinella persica]|uniref:ATP-binding protein n=1 Tax=Neolewinella persica TaxID=70998 RepID=UPI00037BF2C5|nr:ATP-binding protein [Neolewinella persica]
MITRHIEQAIKSQIGKYPVITITGPRQSGKTTLIKTLFSDLPYFSVENPDTREQIEDDPRGFFQLYGHRLVLDEVQRLPILLSYIQGIVDDDKEACFVLSGSHNMLMMESVSQTLAGRTTIFYLQPLSYAEIRKDYPNTTALNQMWRGGYPRIYDRDIDPTEFYLAYAETYVQRDVREVKNIGNLRSFSRFLAICAGYIGQTINYSTLAEAADVSRDTVKSWLSVLETSYVLYQVSPYFKNFKKRLIKSPKLYFRDTGLACSLLGINSAEELNTYYQKGAIFENFVFNELAKGFYNAGRRPPFYFWRDRSQHEVDLLLNRGISIDPVEIKSSATFRMDFFKQLDWFRKVADIPIGEATVIYGGEDEWRSDSRRVLSWKNIDQLVAP